MQILCVWWGYRCLKSAGEKKTNDAEGIGSLWPDSRSKYHITSGQRNTKPSIIVLFTIVPVN